MHLRLGAILAGAPSCPSPAVAAARLRRRAQRHRAGPARAGLGRGDGFDVVQRAGIAMWSRRSGSAYRLVMQRGAAPARLVSVPPAPFAFDVDLGTDAAGRTVAVYSRCASRRRLPWRTRCRLFELDPGTQAERRLAEVARRGVSQVRPAINRGILAYAEVPPTRRRGRARIALKRLGTATPPRTVKTFATSDPGDVLGIDYEDERLAFAVSETEDDVVTRTLSLKEPGGRVRTLAVGYTGEENNQIPTSPSFAGRWLYWSFANYNAYAEPNGFVVRRDLLTGDVATDAVPGYLVALAADAAKPSRRLLIVSDRKAEGFGDLYGTQRMRRVRRPSFEDPPAGLSLRDSLGLPSP